MKKSHCFTMTFTTKSVKCRDIVLQGLYTTCNTFRIRVSNPCATYILSMMLRSRLTVVSRKAKKEQSESPKTKHTTNYCVSFTQANDFVI